MAIRKCRTDHFPVEDISWHSPFSALLQASASTFLAVEAENAAPPSACRTFPLPLLRFPNLPPFMSSPSFTLHCKPISLSLSQVKLHFPKAAMPTAMNCNLAALFLPCVRSKGPFPKQSMTIHRPCRACVQAYYAPVEQGVRYISSPLA
jgi:hypothetical protein